jgi:hypothetical protein
VLECSEKSSESYYHPIIRKYDKQFLNTSGFVRNTVTPFYQQSKYGGAANLMSENSTKRAGILVL